MHDHTEHAQTKGYETQDFGFKIVIYCFIGLGALTAFSILVTIAFYIGLERKLVPAPAPDASPLAAERTLPPSPVLQAYPPAEMDTYLVQMEDHLNSYGWIDKSQGVVHIPIDDAIAIVGSGGVAPAASAPPPAAVGEVDAH